MFASFIFALTAVLPLSRLHACVGASRARSLFASYLRPSSGYAFPRIILSLFLALQLSLAGAVPSQAHVNGELAGGAASIKTVTSADASKHGLQKSSGSNTLYDEATGINYAVGKDGLIYEVSSLSGFNPIPLSKPLTSATNNVPSRPLTAGDLGINGQLDELTGTFSVQNGVANVRIDMIEGTIGNPLSVGDNIIDTARVNGATSLRLEGTLANDRLLAIMQRRYGATTSGANDVIDIQF